MSKYITIHNTFKIPVDFHFNCDTTVVKSLKSCEFDSLTFNESEKEGFIKIPANTIIEVLDGKLTQQFLHIQKNSLRTVQQPEGKKAKAKEQE